MAVSQRTRARRGGVNSSVDASVCVSPSCSQVRSRGLPDDFVGQKVRVVDIEGQSLVILHLTVRHPSPPPSPTEGIDSNMCCGTHVSNLADIQCIHLLYTENKRGSTLLYYVAGSRVMLHLSHAVNVERRLNKLLRWVAIMPASAPPSPLLLLLPSVGQEEHCEAVDRLLKSSKQMSKVLQGFNTPPLILTLPSFHASLSPSHHNHRWSEPS